MYKAQVALESEFKWQRKEQRKFGGGSGTARGPFTRLFSLDIAS